MTLQQVFNYNDQSVKVLSNDNNTSWFIGSEIGKILQYVKTRNAIAAHVDDEDKMTLEQFKSKYGNITR